MTTCHRHRAWRAAWLRACRQGQYPAVP